MRLWHDPFPYYASEQDLPFWDHALTFQNKVSVGELRKRVGDFGDLGRNRRSLFPTPVDSGDMWGRDPGYAGEAATGAATMAQGPTSSDVAGGDGGSLLAAAGVKDGGHVSGAVEPQDVAPNNRRDPWDPLAACLAKSVYWLNHVRPLIYANSTGTVPAFSPAAAATTKADSSNGSLVANTAAICTALWDGAVNLSIGSGDSRKNHLLQSVTSFMTYLVEHASHVETGRWLDGEDDTGSCYDSDGCDDGDDNAAERHRLAVLRHEAYVKKRVDQSAKNYLCVLGGDEFVRLQPE